MAGDWKIPLVAPLVGEEEARAVYEVVLSGWLSAGPKVPQFEKAFAAFMGVKHAVAFCNGTVSLHAILCALGIGPGDEVIVPAMTFIATATSVLHAGATPIFCDVDRRTLNLDPSKLEQRITHRTKVIMPVHYGGQSCDLTSILEIAAKDDLVVIEDAAQAHGATFQGKSVGSFGKAAMFSFTPNKNITTGEGGIVTTGDDELAERLRLLRNHGMRRPYEHVLVGYNYRMTELQAALGIEQLKRLPSIVEQKQRNAKYLSGRLNEIRGITPPYIAPDRSHVYMLYTIRVDKRVTNVTSAELEQGLAEKGIQTRVYYPPMYRQPILRAHGYHEGLCPVAEQVADEILSLPSHARLTERDLAYMVESIADVVRAHRQN